MQLCPVFADPVTFFIVDTLVTEVLFIQVLIRDLPIMYEILPIMLTAVLKILPIMVQLMLKLCSIFYSSVPVICYQICTPWLNSNCQKH